MQSSHAIAPFYSNVIGRPVSKQIRSIAQSVLVHLTSYGGVQIECIDVNLPSFSGTALYYFKLGQNNGHITYLVWYGCVSIFSQPKTISSIFSLVEMLPSLN